MMDRFEDVIGAVAVVLLLTAAFWLGHGAGFPTGGAEMIARVP